MIQVNAWVYRFIENCRRKTNQCIRGPLQVHELQDAKYRLIAQTQKEHFNEEYKSLQRERELPKQSRLLSLNPSLDSDGLIRSDSRLKYEFLSYDSRYPIILPRGSWVTKLIVKQYHQRSSHSGTNQTLTALSEQYWVVAAREEIRDWERKCAVCRRRKAKPTHQIMAPLPNIRVQVPLRAFVHTAVDYAGPFVTIQGRGKQRTKRYLCLFTCMGCRAVHLEVAYSLDTD